MRALHSVELRFASGTLALLSLVFASTTEVIGTGPAIGSIKLIVPDSKVTSRFLKNGVWLVIPKRNTVIDTPCGSVSIAAGCFALVVATDWRLAVYHLKDGRKGTITIKSDSECATIQPGHTAVVTKLITESFESINPCPLVRYRNVTSRPIPSNAEIFEAEFDDVSMTDVLNRSVTDSDAPETRRVMTRQKRSAQRHAEPHPPGYQPYIYYVSPPAGQSIPQTIENK